MSGIPRRFLALCVAMMAVDVRSQSSSLIPQSSFSVDKVKSTWMLTGYIIELEFSGSPLPQVHHRSASTGVAQHTPMLPGGKVKFWSYDNQLTVNLLHSGGYHVLHLHVANNSVEQSASDVQMFLGGANADGDFVYNRGRDVDVSVTFRASGSQLDSLSLFKTGFAQKSNIWGDQVDFTSGAHVIERLRYNENYGERVMVLRVKGRSFSGQGLLAMDASARFGCNGLNNCILRQYEIAAQIPVYRRDMSGPFPPRFIGFELLEGEELSDEKECPVGVSTMCSIDCIVFGDQPSEIEFERLDDGNNNQLNPTGRVSLSNGAHWAYGRLEFAVLQIGASARYRCSSSRGSLTLSFTTTVTAVSRW